MSWCSAGWRQRPPGASTGHFCKIVALVVPGPGWGAGRYGSSYPGYRSDIPRARPACALLIVLTLLGGARAYAKEPPCRNVTLLPNASNLAKIERATLCLINEVRDHRHLHPLRLNDDLRAVAAGQATEMVLGDYFGDDSRSGQTPLQRIVASSYPSHAARVSTAQNIGWGTGASATPLGMFKAWMLSRPHREIILTPGYRDVGVGVAPSVPTSVAPGSRGATYTVEFGVRRTPHRGSSNRR